MASAVEAALEREHVLLCEAGTGTGKTLAYLLPAVLSGKKVVVSTATRALQEQIFDKDLPLVAKLLGRPVEAALMKGLGNYVCHTRYERLAATTEGAPLGPRSVRRVAEWVATTQTGDIAELPDVREDDALWPLIVSGSDTRIGPRCEHFERCFVTQMKRRAQQARIVVVNHHLFFADLALRGPHPGRVLPDYEAVIFDEAHQLEDIATAFFSVRVSSARVAALVRDLEAACTDVASTRGARDGPGGALSVLPRVVEGAERGADALWRVVAGAASAPEGRTLVGPEFWEGPARAACDALDTALEALEGQCKALGEPVHGSGADALDTARECFAALGRRVAELRGDLTTLAEPRPERVGWLERSARGTAVGASPVQVGGIFRESLFDAIGAIVLTSATLASGRRRVKQDASPRADAATGGAAMVAGEGGEDAGEDGAARDAARRATSAFGFLRGRLGLDGELPPVTELVVGSPFDYAERALLYVPEDLPDPSDARFGIQAAERAAELIADARGGAFVLCTSVRSMRALHAELGRRVGGRRVTMQGAAPKRVLVGEFIADGSAVLVATMSFWQGVDVPGSALRLVIIDKIPFPVPTDPLVVARSQAIEAAGGRAFVELHLPLAETALQQGFGRLIRTRDDHGVVAILDGRLHRKGYGRRLLAALPPARRTTELAAVRRFWQGFPAAPSSPEETR